MYELFFVCFRTGSSSTGRGSSNSVAMSPTSDLAAQYVQVEVASPEDQQFIVYTEWKTNKTHQFFELTEEIISKKIVKSLYIQAHTNAFN